MNSGISRDAWLAALGQADIVDDPDALTITDLARLLGVGERTAYVKAAQLVKSGKAVEVLKRKAGSTLGRRPIVKAYRLVTTTDVEVSHADEARRG